MKLITSKTDFGNVHSVAIRGSVGLFLNHIVGTEDFWISDEVAGESYPVEVGFTEEMEFLANNNNPSNFS